MQIHWCLEHNSPLLVERDLYGQTLQLCQLAAWDETETGDCRFDVMYLVRFIDDEHPRWRISGPSATPDQMFYVDAETPT